MPYWLTALRAALHGYAGLLTTVPRFPRPDRADTIARIVGGLARITSATG